VKVTELALPGVLLLEPRVFEDERGAFIESWSAGRYAACGVPSAFAQDNVSWSHAGVIRGLHLQNPHGQGKLLSVLHGEVFDVAVDVRPDSPTFGRWVGSTLSSANHRQMYIPPGFAHGFAVTKGEAIFAYKCTSDYDPRSEISVRWDDPAIGIEWPVTAPIVSARDAQAPLLRDVPADRLPRLGS
jgi:dTDP-4-dehydrorhamnose 3,5-epimerase